MIMVEEEDLDKVSSTNHKDEEGDNKSGGAWESNSSLSRSKVSDEDDGDGDDKDDNDNINGDNENKAPASSHGTAQEKVETNCRCAHQTAYQNMFLKTS